MQSQVERLDLIRQKLDEKKAISTREIMKLCHVSFDTARRDVIKLTSTGQAIRIHGGLMKIKQGTVPDYNSRVHVLSPIKNKIAKMTAKYLTADKLIYLNASTTISQLCCYLNGLNATVMTNSIDNADALMMDNLPNVILLGGYLNKENHYTSSLNSLKEIDQYEFDIAVIGTSSVNKNGVFVVNHSDAQIEREVVNRTKTVILLAEEYKFKEDRSSPYKVMDCKQADILITDNKLDPQYRKYFKKNIKIREVLEEEKEKSK